MNRQAQRRGSSVSSTAGNSPVSKPRIKLTACRRCHARKVKCSGGTPCEGCVQSRCANDCTYPRRDRQVRVSQSYIDRLLAENRQLRHKNRDGDNAEQSAAAVTSLPQGTQPTSGGDRSEGPVHNPLFDDRPWFLRISTSEAPALIGEAADAAFATRFRQVLSDTQLSHIPRVHYPSDDLILSLSGSRVPAPTPGRARFLLKSALAAITGPYHIVLKSAVVDGLEKFLRSPADCGFFLTCKIWALLALGELYSTRSVSSDLAFPGLAYYAQATKVTQALQERPCIDAIEIQLLLCLYALSSNRRHSAYCLAGSAVRLGVILGLYLNVPEAQLSNRVTREHRNRVWWTAYDFDQLLASRLGQSASIPDGDIQVDLPSSTGLPDNVQGDFADAEPLVAHIKLAELAGQITQSLYRRRTQKEPFSQRVQQALKKLQGWVQDLPDRLQFEKHQSSQPVPHPIRSLRLSFNQCMILATRPVLLYVLSTRRNSRRGSTPNSQTEISEDVLALAEACVRCSRHSYSLLMECWIDGSFFTFDYFSTQYLFSAATILAVSALLGGPRSPKDEEDFEQAAQLLADLDKNGSFAAKEYSQHVTAMKASINALPSRGPPRQAQDPSDVQQQGIVVSGEPGIPYPLADLSYSNSLMTAEMALAEPSVQAFLSQTDPSLQHMDLSMLDNGLGSFYWPDDGTQTR